MGNTVFFSFQKVKVLGLISSSEKGSKLKYLTLDNSACIDSEESLQDSLIHQLRQFVSGKSKPENCILVLHRQEIGITQLEVPHGDDWEIASMLELDLPACLPLKLDEITWGWERCTPIDEENDSIQVYWSPLQPILQNLSVLQQAGLGNVVVIPDIAAYRHVLSNLLASQEQSPDWMLRIAETEFELVHWDSAGQVLFSRGRQFSALQDCEPQHGTVLKQDAIASIQTWREKCALEDSKGIVLFASQWEAIDDALADLSFSRELSPEFSELLDPLNSEKTVSFLPLLAVWRFWQELNRGKRSPQKSPLNMLPYSLRRQHLAASLRNLVWQASLLALLVCVLGGGNIWFYIETLQKKAQFNQAQIEILRPQVKDVEAMEERLSSIRGQIDYVISPLDAIYKMNKIMADNAATLDGIYLDKMTYQGDGQIEVEGNSTNDITPWRFSEILAKTPPFQIVDPPHLTFNTFGGTRAIRFDMRLRAGAVPVSASGPSSEPIVKAGDEQK